MFDGTSVNILSVASRLMKLCKDQTFLTQHKHSEMRFNVCLTISHQLTAKSPEYKQQLHSKRPQQCAPLIIFITIICLIIIIIITITEIKAKKLKIKKSFNWFFSKAESYFSANRGCHTLRAALFFSAAWSLVKRSLVCLGFNLH